MISVTAMRVCAGFGRKAKSRHSDIDVAAVISPRSASAVRVLGKKRRDKGAKVRDRKRPQVMSLDRKYRAARTRAGTESNSSASPLGDCALLLGDL